MTVTQAQAQMLTELARACRPHGARTWDSAGVMAAIKAVCDRDLATVILATIRAASDRDIDTPGVIPTNGSHWNETAAVSTYTPRTIDKTDCCGICSKTRARCQTERLADDDHEFDDGRRKELDVPRTVAALREQIVPIAPPAEPIPLADRVAALPRDPVLERVRAQLREQPSESSIESAAGESVAEGVSHG